VGGFVVSGNKTSRRIREQDESHSPRGFGAGRVSSAIRGRWLRSTSPFGAAGLMSPLTTLLLYGSSNTVWFSAPARHWRFSGPGFSPQTGRHSKHCSRGHPAWHRRFSGPGWACWSGKRQRPRSAPGVSQRVGPAGERNRAIRNRPCRTGIGPESIKKQICWPIRR
jgi:hypothetical protein